MQKFDVRSLLQKLEELNVRPNKKLGQNFLINQDTCQKIIEVAFRTRPSYVVEVGPGLGALTEVILEKNIPLTLIELDRTFADYWLERGLNVVQGDALQINWGQMQLPENTLLVSNLPYQISASLVIDRSIESYHISKMVLMFQKEVAQRIQAHHGSEGYGLLSVIAQSFWMISVVMDVGSKDFYPPPKIASRVLLFEKKQNEIPNAPKFLSFVKAAFAQRRKLLVKNLSSQFSKEILLEKMKGLGLLEKARAEDLSVQQFIELYKSLR